MGSCSTRISTDMLGTQPCRNLRCTNGSKGPLTWDMITLDMILYGMVVHTCPKSHLGRRIEMLIYAPE